MDIAGAQHYVECSLCPKNTQYHCSTCKDNLCEECKIKHEKSNASRNHTIVLYHTRDKSAPEVEICKVHPTLTYEMCCQQCEVPVCSRCVKEKHNGHRFIDTKVLYSEKKNILEKDLKDIKNNSIPKFHLLLEDVKDDAQKCKETITKIRSSMKAKANAIKTVVDDILSEELSYLDALENSILSELERQETTLNNNISHLNNIVDELQAYLKENKLAEMILIERERKDQRLTEIPTLEKPNFPSFIEGELKRDIIKSLFGKLSLSKTRSIRYIEVKKNEITYKLGQQVFQVATVPGDMAATRYGNRILFQIPDCIWVFNSGQLTQIDMKGKMKNTIPTKNDFPSCFTLNGQNELLYLDGNDIKKFTEHTNSEIVMRIQKWKPLAVCFSHFSESLIIVGDQDKKTKKYPAVIYDKNKREVCQGDFDITPQFIVGNINGDICISSNSEKTVEVKDKSLNHRFTYHGGPHHSWFSPYSVCTDVLGHILVCNAHFINISVHMLDRDGNFISLLLTLQDHGIYPLCITTDEKHNLLIGDLRKSIKVYKYLEAI